MVTDAVRETDVGNTTQWQPDPSKELNDGNVDLQVYSDGYGAVAIAVPDASDVVFLHFH